MLTVRFQFVECAPRLAQPKSLVNVFVPGGGAMEVVVARHGDPSHCSEVKLAWSPGPPCRGFVGFFWYVPELDDNHYTSSSLKGHVYVPIHHSREPQTHAFQYQGHDTSIPSMGRILVSIDFQGSAEEEDKQERLVEDAISRPWYPALEAFAFQSTKWLSENYPPKRQAAVMSDGLAPLANTQRPMPFWSRPLDLPMWAFSYAAHLGQLWDDADTALFLSHAVEWAVFRLRQPRSLLRDPEPASLETILEIACEAACLLSVSMPYRVDKQRSRNVDEWCYLLQHPNLALEGGDCDDLAELTLRVVLQLQKHKTWASTCPFPALAKRIQSALALYEACNCLGTLKLDTHTNVWHAFVMLFDKDWIRSRGLSAPRYAPLLLESTAWATSCHSFEDGIPPFPVATFQACQSAHPEFHILDDQFAPALMSRKANMESLRSGPPYLHLVVAFTPQLIESHQMAEVYFTQGSQLGVPLMDVWSGKLVPTLRTSVASVDRECLQEARDYMGWHPPVFPFPKPPVPAVVPWVQYSETMPRHVPSCFYFSCTAYSSEETLKAKKQWDKLTAQAKRLGAVRAFETQIELFHRFRVLFAGFMYLT